MPADKNKHLSLADRSFIEAQLAMKTSISEIARQLNVHKTTVSREIKNHLQPEAPITRRSDNGTGSYDCAFLHECSTNKTFCKEWSNCDKRKPAACTVRDKKGFCNGCPNAKTRGCKLAKKLYRAEDAQLEYEKALVQSRTGIGISSEDLSMVADFVEEGTKLGHSLSVIAHNHPECPVSVRTLYNYVDDRRFADKGVLNMDLPEKKRRRHRTKYRINKDKKTKVRRSKKYLKDREFSDFENYTALHPDQTVWEMDTVYNREEGPFIQTFIMRDKPSLFLARFQTHKLAEDMYQGLKAIHDSLGRDMFKEFFPIILTDRGTEFSAAEKIEALGCHIFYCDAMQSTQKAKVENKHRLLRRIIVNEKDIYDLGLKDQAAMDTVVSHIDSYPLESLGWKTPYESFAWHFGEDFLQKLNIARISPEEVRLKPDLLTR